MTISNNKHFAAAVIGMLMLLALPSNSFSFPPSIQNSVLTTTQLSATIQPSESTTIGTVGNGYLPILLSKLAAHRQHGKSWIICPTADIEKMRELSAVSDGFASDIMANHELVSASDTDRVEELLGQTDALLVATDDVDSVVDPSILKYLLAPEKVPRMKRVVAMSRNLNGAGMGFFVNASRRAANAQVWDNGNKAAFSQFEADVRSAAQSCGADWTIVRAGTLKGGATGENNEYPQYLAETYYEMTKRDIITWQLLFDCGVRGVKLARGDVMSGPGVQAVFTAVGSEEHEGDSGRCGVAEAMVRSLEVDGAANVDFGVGTVASREAPSDKEWEALFQECLS